MNRQLRNIAAFSLAFALFAPTLSAQEKQENIPLPNITIEESISADAYDAEKARALLADAAKNQDLEKLASLLAAVEKCDAVGADRDLYAAAYYEALLDDAEKTPEGLDAFAKRLRADAKEKDSAASVAATIFRALARYDVELADASYCRFVDDLARSESAERQAYAKQHAGRLDLLRPYAPSDASLNKALEPIPDELDAESIRVRQAETTSARNAFCAVVPFNARGSLQNFLNAENKLSKMEREKGVQYKTFQDVLEHLNRAPDSAAVQQVRVAVKEQNPDLYRQAEERLATSYVYGVIREIGSAKNVEDAARTAAKLCAKEINEANPKLRSTLAGQVNSGLAHLVDLQARDASVLDVFAEEFRTALAPNLIQYADAADGLIRLRSLVGKELELEGICFDGSEYSIKNDRGKVVLAIFSSNARSADARALDALRRYPDKLAVVEYISDVDLPTNYALQRDWQTLSRVRSNEDKKLGGKEYVDFAARYGFLYPRSCEPLLIVGSDGRVVALSVARPMNVADELQRIFNEK